jgi:SHS2 domain-containing protein
MSKSGFELVEHTADAGVRAWGPDISSLFRAMAQGVFAIITDPALVRAEQERLVTLDAESLPDLLHEWLEELNSLHQIHRELYVEVEPEVDRLHLEATIRGEPIDIERHELRIEVKAITWHDLKLETTAGGFEAYVLLDI